MEIEVGRLLVVKAAWELDRGGFARKEVSMAKVQVANVLHRAADVAIQINGARGYSKDTVLEWIYRYARQARLVDGADEVHRMVLNRFLDEEGSDFWRWPAAEALKMGLRPASPVPGSMWPKSLSCRKVNGCPPHTAKLTDSRHKWRPTLVPQWHKGNGRVS